MKKSRIPQRYLLVAFTFLISVLMYVDRACIGAAKGSVSTEFGLSNIQWAWVMAIFTLGYALFQNPGGKLADKKGPRLVIAGIISAWSLLTALTGIAWNFISMLVIRFSFGASEAGAFPSLARVVYRWFPVNERGIVQGINFSGSRIGGALAYPIVVALIAAYGWRASFFIFGAVGVLFAIAWWVYFRNSPEESPFVGETEKKYIVSNRQQDSSKGDRSLSFLRILKSWNVILAMLQYIASNFTFYFTLTWMFPYLKEALKNSGSATGFWAMAPLLGGAVGNWLSGILVDQIYNRTGKLTLSRRLPAIIGFSLATLGVIAMTQAPSDLGKVLFLTLAIFGADMTLSPSWAFCIDIGNENAGAVSGTMNMAGNLGAFTSILAFGYLADSLINNGVDPRLALAGNDAFFFICAGLSFFAIVAWLFMDPNKAIEKK